MSIQYKEFPTTDLNHVQVATSPSPDQTRRHGHDQTSRHGRDRGGEKETSRKFSKYGTGNKDAHILAAKTSEQSRSEPCDGCGWRDKGCQNQRGCIFKAHPGYNNEKTSWKASTNGKLYATNTPNGFGKEAGRVALAAKFQPSGELLTTEVLDSLRKKGVPMPKEGVRETNKRKFDDAAGEIMDHHMLATYKTGANTHYLRSFTLSKTQGRTKSGDNLKIDALIDSGAVTNSYISINLAKQLDELGYKPFIMHKRVCTGFENMKCTDTTHAYKVEFFFVNELTKLEEIIALEAQVIDSRFDLIIGLPDIVAFDFCHKFPSLFSKDWQTPRQEIDIQANDTTTSKAILVIFS